MWENAVDLCFMSLFIFLFFTTLKIVNNHNRKRKWGGLSLLGDLFTKPKKRKYATIPSDGTKADVPEGIMTKMSRM